LIPFGSAVVRMSRSGDVRSVEMGTTGDDNVIGPVSFVPFR
jgi:hypothetical protein